MQSCITVTMIAGIGGINAIVVVTGMIYKSLKGLKMAKMKYNGFTIVELLLIIAFILIFVGCIFFFSLTIRSCKETQKMGLKTVIERIWHGEEEEKNNE